MAMDIVISVWLLLVGIAALVVIRVCVAGRLFRVGSQNGALVHGFGTNQNSRVLSAEEFNRLPCFDYFAQGSTSDTSGSRGAECAVCLETFKVGDKCRLLPNCGHSFHVHCIDSWLLKMPVCPICRSFVKEDTPRGGKEELLVGSAAVIPGGSGGDIVLELT